MLSSMSHADRAAAFAVYNRVTRPKEEAARAEPERQQETRILAGVATSAVPELWVRTAPLPPASGAGSSSGSGRKLTPMRRARGYAGGTRRVRELGRNREGGCYVREAVRGRDGQSRVLTWQIARIGEDLLARHDVEVGQRIPDHLFSELRARGWLHTKTSR